MMIKSENEKNGTAVAERRALPREIKRNSEETAAIAARDFNAYQLAIMHDWLRTLTLLAAFLIPLFFVLDVFTMPASLLSTFAVYRAASLALTVGQLFVVRKTKPGRWSYLHGYLLSFHVGGMISLMTVALGGFGSSYYAGLNLVIIGVNLLMPWREYHTFFNAVLIVGMYVLLNLTGGSAYEPSALVNNLFFLGATSVLSIGINFVRFRLIRREFSLVVDLGRARDELQGEKEIVEDRTKSLKSLLDVSGQGFLSFDARLIVSPEYSRECRNIFRREIVGRRVDQLLYKDRQAAADFRTGLGLYFSGKASPEAIFVHLDDRFEIGNKIIRAAYKAVHENSVMMILSDITEELRRQERTRRENEMWSMLRRVIANKQAFGFFERQAQAVLAALGGRDSGYGALLQDIHTLKGNAGFLGFARTQGAAHRLEERLGDAIALGEDERPEREAAALRNAFDDEMAIVVRSLGPAWKLDVESVNVPRHEYVKIEDYVRSVCPDPAVIRMMEEHRKKPVPQLLARFPDLAEQIAARLGKRLGPIRIRGSSIGVVPEEYEELIDSCAHIVRNLVDHGIEPPAEREAKGKPPAGQIRIGVSECPDGLRITFRDDGRGIDAGKVAERARELGYIADGDPPDECGLLDFIFRDNFSTSAAVSEISGRGVGLAAVRSAARKMGGDVTVKTWANRGTQFTVTVPPSRTVGGEAAS